MTEPKAEVMVSHPESESEPHLSRPQMLRFHSSPLVNTLSPTRQQFRLGNIRPREIKETMDAKYRADKFGKTIIINQYKLENDIARASYGSVRVAVDENQNKYAVKEYSKIQLQKASRAAMMRQRRKKTLIEGDFSPLGLVRHEIAIMKKLDHPNIVSLVEMLDDPHGDALYMILEWCEKGVVLKQDHQGESPYTEEQCRLIIRDVILGIEYLHSQGVIHRDIKVDNILVDEDDVVKIVDFGVSEIFEKENDTIKKTAGSPAYMAPELAKLSNGTNIEQVQQVAGRPADIWSMGVTLYFILTGRLPFRADSLMDLFDSIIHDDFDTENMSEDLVDLFHKVLEKDPAKRIKMAELRVHPWITRHGEDYLLPYEENTSDTMTPITEEDLQSAFEQIKGVMDVDQASEKLKRLHGWRGGTIKSRDPSPVSVRSSPPRTEEGSVLASSRRGSSGSSSGSESVASVSCGGSSSSSIKNGESGGNTTGDSALLSANYNRLSRALDEIVNKRSVSNPGISRPCTPPAKSEIKRQREPQQKPSTERRRSRSRSRTRPNPLELTALTVDRSRSLEPNTKL